MQNPLKVKVAGIHLAGPNSTKTTLVIMTGQLGEGNLKISGIYDRMGTVNRLFSDDRLFEVLRAESPDRVMIDSPLSVPPCVACTRPSCPGVNACEDIAVAYMQKLVDTKGGKRKRKPMNPQTQRIWDVKEWYHWHPSLQEPTYSANKAPLVVRGLTLQRRLRSLEEPIQLYETSVPHALSVFVEQLELAREIGYQYRAFGIGRERRQAFIKALMKAGVVDGSKMEDVTATVETFSAFVTAVMAGLEVKGRVSRPENEFFSNQGWVYLPELNPVLRSPEPLIN
ncbi:MAG: hypothetical protein H7249_05050 [Chitinophagaceae bacterium]|nr:hypothetical protein [Oligoflexus sp.]